MAWSTYLCRSRGQEMEHPCRPLTTKEAMLYEESALRPAQHMVENAGRTRGLPLDTTGQLYNSNKQQNMRICSRCSQTNRRSPLIRCSPVRPLQTSSYGNKLHYPSKRSPPRMRTPEEKIRPHPIAYHTHSENDQR